MKKKLAPRARRSPSAAEKLDLRAIDQGVDHAMQEGHLAAAADEAIRLAALRRGSRWYPVPRVEDPEVPPRGSPAPMLTPSKLLHDIAQFQYLQGRGILGDEFTSVIDRYETVLEGLAPLGEAARVPMSGAVRAEIGNVYGRIVHVRDTPRVARPFSGSWTGSAVEDAYLGEQPNVVVVDDFLSAEAIESLREFCLESTVWLTNRYDHGRLGAFFRDGFSCPLLAQIAEELRAALPRVIGRRHPLRQIWGFKYANTQPCLGSHADFAAVNVNFWITPDAANLDPGGGGLHLYDVAAPRDWTFDMYNRGGDRIRELLQSLGATPRHIPYRYNRAVIFDSDLFHATPALRFREGYENRRVNVTFLYGDRLRDGYAAL
jgi:hypothetical protein